MVDIIIQFLRFPAGPAPGVGSAAVPEDVRLAACVLLLELAHADGELAEDERLHLHLEVRRQFGLGRVEAEELLEMAEKARVEAVGLSQFTSVIAANYSTDQKNVLAGIMRSLVPSDTELAGRGNYLLRKMSSLLRLEPELV